MREGNEKGKDCRKSPLGMNSRTHFSFFPFSFFSFPESHRFSDAPGEENGEKAFFHPSPALCAGGAARNASANPEFHGKKT